MFISHLSENHDLCSVQSMLDFTDELVQREHFQSISLPDIHAVSYEGTFLRGPYMVIHNNSNVFKIKEERFMGLHYFAFEWDASPRLGMNTNCWFSRAEALTQRLCLSERSCSVWRMTSGPFWRRTGNTRSCWLKVLQFVYCPFYDRQVLPGSPWPRTTH